jgi:hypothetical protein
MLELIVAFLAGSFASFFRQLLAIRKRPIARSTRFLEKCP